MFDLNQIPEKRDQNPYNLPAVTLTVKVKNFRAIKWWIFDDGSVFKETFMYELAILALLTCTGVSSMQMTLTSLQVLVWTGLAGGDGEYCAILVAVNSLLQMVLFTRLRYPSSVSFAARTPA